MFRCSIVSRVWASPVIASVNLVSARSSRLSPVSRSVSAVAVDECVGAYDAHSGEVTVLNALADTVLIDGIAEIFEVVVEVIFLVSDGLVGLFGILEFARGGS